MDRERFLSAMGLALDAHADQVRKGTTTPYISHPIGVASLVMEDGGSDDETCAALLHDVLEDGGADYVDLIRQSLGPTVLSIVEECSDSVAQAGVERADWKDRKLAYLAQIPSKSPGAIRVTTADKLHNARAIVADLIDGGPSVFLRFSRGQDDVLWYYDAISEALAGHDAARPRLASELRRTVARMHESS